MADLFNLSIDELYSRCQSIKDFYGFVHPDDLEIYKKHTDSIKKHLDDFRDAHVFEYRLLLPDRITRHVREMEFGVFDDLGNIQRSFGVIQDIEDAFSWRNHGKLADSAQKLKSSARSLGAIDLGDLCQLLEKASRIFIARFPAVTILFQFCD